MTSSNDFLFELGCEELPARYLTSLIAFFNEQCPLLCAQRGLTYTSCKVFATPRRLAFLIQGLPEQTPDEIILKKGPAAAQGQDNEGKPSKALEGFARGAGVPVEALYVEEGYWYARIHQKGRATREHLPSLVEQLFKVLPLQKPMHWGEHRGPFIRPVRWLVALWNEEVLPCSLFGITADRLTHGHRFKTTSPLILTQAHDYEALLSQQGYVIPCFDQRRTLIRQQLLEHALSLNAQWQPDEALLEEVTGLVEWPSVFQGTIAMHFLELPKEVIVTSLKHHQKSFGIEDSQGRIVPVFLGVSHLPKPLSKEVIDGNERVVRARLSDAQFFYHLDRSKSLEALLPGLDTIQYQKNLGSLGDKSRRLAQLVCTIGSSIATDTTDAVRAATLCKADLITGMVGEFPEMQGVMGKYYALHSRESETVACAIQEHYLPKNADDQLPQSIEGTLVAFADRLDHLVGLFAQGHLPTADKDPFALRRAAIGLVRLCVEKQLPFTLTASIEAAAQAYETLITQVPVATLKPFILERTHHWHLDQGYSSDVLNAVSAVQDEWLWDHHARVMALQPFKQTPAAHALAEAHKRLHHLLQKNAADQSIDLEPKQFQQPQEHQLFDVLTAVERDVAQHMASHEYTAVLNDLAELQNPVADFFEHVMVMAEEPAVRANRLALLTRLHRLFASFADFSKLQWRS